MLPPSSVRLSSSETSWPATWVTKTFMITRSAPVLAPHCISVVGTLFNFSSAGSTYWAFVAKIVTICTLASGDGAVMWMTIRSYLTAWPSHVEISTHPTVQSYAAQPTGACQSLPRLLAATSATSGASTERHPGPRSLCIHMVQRQHALKCCR